MTQDFSWQRSGRLLSLGAVVLLAACGVSQQQEVQMGQQEVQQVNAQLPIVTDVAVNRYLNILGDSLAHVTSRADLDWHFYMVNTNDFNAFALPGGYIYVNRGVAERSDYMDQFASVIAHEIGHVVLRHSVKQMEQMQGANLGVTLACALTGVCNNQVAAAAINVGGTAVFAKFSRTDEVQADEGGFKNEMNAGLNPRGMLTFFQKLLAEEQRSGGSGATAGWFADHPGTQDRIADVQRMLSQVPASTLNSLRNDSNAFQSMKQRMSQLPVASR